MNQQVAFNLLKNVLKLEAEALVKASEKITAQKGEQLIQIFNDLQQREGSLFFIGVGKSGLIAHKLASTFTSLGLPSFILHPIEALHGDLGRLRRCDTIVLVSKSGNTEEILKLLPFIEIPKSQRIGLLGNINSPIGKECGLVFDCSVEKEACLNDQAPTTSSTLALAMGDAMAVVYEKIIGLSKEDFAINHPGGLLGKKLRIKVKDLMVSYEKCPCGQEDAKWRDILMAMTNRPVGGFAFLDESRHLKGIMVEGDIRRALVNDIDLNAKLLHLMNKNPITINENELAYEGLLMMEDRDRPISILPVIGDDKTFKGFLRLHDLIKNGLIKN